MSPELADAQRSSLNEVGWMWAQQDAPAAAAFALTLGKEAEAGLLPQIAQHWAGRDAAAAIAWGRQLPEGTARDQFLASAVGRMAQQDPKTAAAQLPQLPLAQQEAAAGQIARSLARSSPEEAARWASQLPEDSNVRGNAYGQILADWVEGDPYRASEWLVKLPSGQSRDAAVSTFAIRLRDTDPDSAAVWAGSIANEGQRNASQQTQR